MKRHTGQAQASTTTLHFCVHHIRMRRDPVNRVSRPAALVCFTCPYGSAEEAARRCPDYKPARCRQP